MPRKLLGAAAEFIELKYGGAVGETITVESVGVAQSRILRNDPERVFVLLVNLSVNTIFVGYDEQVSSGRGILLGSNGGTYQVDVEEDFTLPINSMFALATGAASNLFVVTVRRIDKIVGEAA